MASYLEAYGADEERHAKRVRLVKWSLSILVAGALSALILFSIFENFSEERKVGAFLDRLKAKDYQTAYRMWGCTDATPCRDYSFDRFMTDWGPNSPHSDAAAAHVGSGDTCGTGVLVPVNFKGAEEVPLWVEKASSVIGFAPDPECRKRHWRFRQFIRSLFNKESFLHFDY